MHLSQKMNKCQQMCEAKANTNFFQCKSGLGFYFGRILNPLKISPISYICKPHH